MAEEKKEKKLPSTEDQDLLRQMRKDFETAVNAEQENRIQALESFKFKSGDQWPEEAKRERESERRPMLTMNKVNKFIKRVVGAMRMNRIKTKVKPVDSLADPIRAKVIENIIMHILSNSDADIVFDTGAECQLTGGLGYWRVNTEFSEDDIFSQDIKLKRIPNPFAVYFDPGAEEFLRQDAKYCHITEVVRQDDHDKEYPGKPAVDFENSAFGEEYEKWFYDDKVRRVEYFYKESKKVTYAQLATGEVIELKDGLTVESLEEQGLTVQQTRKVDVDKVMWIKASGTDVLEGPKEWAGKYIPIVPVIGDEVNIAGRTIISGLIQDAKDPQRMYNYWATLITELISQSPKAPYIVTAQQISGYEREWDESNRKLRPYLRYAGGQRPQRERPPDINHALLAERAQSDADIKDTLGMYEASTGAPSNERSGVAINARKKSSDVGNFVFIDNLRRSIEHTSKILIDLIPKIYDTERIFRITGENNEEMTFPINQVVINPRTLEPMIINDITVGKYDVIKTSGPYMDTMREEIVSSMLELAQYMPQIAPLIADKTVESMDFPGADEVAERIKRTLPPEITGEAPPMAGGSQGAPPGAEQLDLPVGNTG